MDLGSKAGIFSGMQYNIFRDGEERISKAIVHAVTEETSTAQIPKKEKRWGIKKGSREDTITAVMETPHLSICFKKRFKRAVQ